LFAVQVSRIGWSPSRVPPNDFVAWFFPWNTAVPGTVTPFASTSTR